VSRVISRRIVNAAVARLYWMHRIVVVASDNVNAEIARRIGSGSLGSRWLVGEIELIDAHIEPEIDGVTEFRARCEKDDYLCMSSIISDPSVVEKIFSGYEINVDPPRIYRRTGDGGIAVYEVDTSVAGFASRMWRGNVAVLDTGDLRKPRALIIASRATSALMVIYVDVESDTVAFTVTRAKISGDSVFAVMRVKLCKRMGRYLVVY